MDTALIAVTDITAKQHTLVTRNQLQKHGLTRHEIDGLVDRRVLDRWRPQVFGIVGVTETWERGLLAAVLAVPEEGALASHSSAARLWSFAYWPEDRYEITVPTERRPRLVGVGVHRTTLLDDADIAQRSGVPCTSFERTLCECTTRMSELQLGRALDDGLRRGVASVRRLKDCAERLDSGPGRRMSVIHGLLGARDPHYDPGGSDDELRVLEVLKRAGLPLPAQQQEVVVDGRTYRPDYAWPVWKIFSEYYGRTTHIGASAVAYDNERITALAAVGWLPLIFTWTTSDDQIVDQAVKAFEARSVWTLRPPQAG